MKQPYSYWLKVLGRVGWDRKESPESNLHVCGEDDTRMAVYNMEECIEKRGLELLENITFKKNHMKRRGEALEKGDC